jgi:transposase
MSPVGDLLEDFADLADVAKAFGRHERTVRRWLDQPDGLPYTRAGCRILIHVPTAREWLMSNLKRRNPRRPA